MDDDHLTPRNDLIGKVQDGELSPEEADAEAVRLGLRPLASVPADDALDPMMLETWTLPMAIAWIAWRSPAAVRAWWGAYRDECRSWHHRNWRIGPDGPVREGFFLKSRPPASVALLRMSAMLDERVHQDAPPSIAIEDAIAWLWRMLARGLVRATAVDCRADERTVIPAEAWQRLKAAETDHDRDEVRDMSRFPFGERYADVLLNVSDIRNAWPVVWNGSQPVPQLVPPTSKGYIPLFCAVHWIASGGGSTEIGWSAEIWRDAYTQVIAGICSDKIEVIGTTGGETKRIDGYTFAACKVVFPFEDHWTHQSDPSSRMTLFSCPYSDEAVWAAGFDDSLRGQDGVRWSRIIVRGDDVTAAWPIGRSETGHETEAYRTGAPGRPTPMQVIKDELEARHGRGETCGTLTGEAEALSKWLAAEHPKALQVTQKTIKNQLRSSFRKLNGGPKKKIISGEFRASFTGLRRPAPSRRSPSASALGPEEKTDAGRPDRAAPPDGSVLSQDRSRRIRPQHLRLPVLTALAR